MYAIDIDLAEKPFAVFVFAHGAGAGKDHHFILEVSRLLVAANISVVRFNFPYMQKREFDNKRRPPDRMPALLTAYQEALAEVHVDPSINQFPLFIGGKSMGSRVAATLLSEAELESTCLENIKGCICLGYPFHPQKKPENLRLAPLQNISLPTLICQGERDALGSEVEINTYSLAEYVKTIFYPDGDHDLKPRVKSGFTHQQHIISASQAIIGFINTHAT